MKGKEKRAGRRVPPRMKNDVHFNDLNGGRAGIGGKRRSGTMDVTALKRGLIKLKTERGPDSRREEDDEAHSG